jgi:acyl-CoA thioester hydrolase
MRWGDMDAQGHVNNAAYLDYLQEARVGFLLSGSPVLHHLLDSGVLVVNHQVEYLKPVAFSDRPLTINLWVDAVGGSRFSIGYDVYDGDDLAVRARSGLVPFDRASNALRRLTAEERDLLGRALAAAEPLRPLPKVAVRGDHHRYPLTVRWSDLDSYGHVNNVKYYDYVQEARISLVSSTVGWEPEAVWMVVHKTWVSQPIDFRRRTSGHGSHSDRQPLLHGGRGNPRSGIESRIEPCFRDGANRRRRCVASERRSAISAGQVGTAGLT